MPQGSPVQDCIQVSSNQAFVSGEKSMCVRLGQRRHEMSLLQNLAFMVPLQKPASNVDPTGPKICGNVSLKWETVCMLHK